MKKEFFKEVEIPEGVEVKKEDNLVIVKGPEGENKKKMNFGKLEVNVGKDKIKLGSKKATKKEKKMTNTLTAHLNNLIKGVQEKFEYELKICFGHFPFTVKIEGNQAIVKNFLGEKVERKVKLPQGAEVTIDKDIIKVTSSNKELAGQTAATLEKSTIVRGRDKRIFQDGIYITKKCGKEI
ncbi:MAG: 50S ribosomal protein L6 [Nanoarchaeota archaeon]|nr:50S ribosomal protein L6 [Nanoarchaeota archaeon]